MYNLIEAELRDWKEDSSIPVLMYKIKWDKGIIVLYTTNPGWLIGKRGCRIEIFRERLKKIWPQFVDFNFVEVWGIV